jgi:hypothetical protein
MPNVPWNDPCNRTQSKLNYRSITTVPKYSTKWFTFTILTSSEFCIICKGESFCGIFGNSCYASIIQFGLCAVARIISWNIRHVMEPPNPISWNIRHFMEPPNPISWNIRHFMEPLNPISWIIQHFVEHSALHGIFANDSCDRTQSETNDSAILCPYQPKYLRIICMIRIWYHLWTWIILWNIWERFFNI